jgi:surfactin synthase thioesterase subunit
MSTPANRWFHTIEHRPEASLRLFLFHYAGSGPAMYHEWSGLLPADVDLQLLHLPGRQERRADPAYTEIGPLIAELHDAFVAEVDDRPYAFFGHSMGALLAYRLAVALDASGERPPALLAASGWAPVGFRTPGPELMDLPQEQIVEWAKGLGGLPPEIYENPEMLALVIPAMRSDLAVCIDYRDDEAPVSCPIVSYSGRSDPLMTEGAMSSWVPRCPEYLGNVEFPGGHFFMHQEGLPITSDLLRLLRGRAAALSR